MKRKRKDKVDLEAGWAAGWHRRRFHEVVKTPDFPGLVTLSRLANMLRFVYSVSVSVKGPGPEARRQSMNAFYLSGALLVEAERTIAGVGRYFSKQDDFIELAKAVHSEDFDNVVGRFRKFRNQAGFHFDEQPVEPALKKIAEREHDFVAFLTAYGTVSKNLYYDLGDQVAMELILGEDEYGEWMKEWLELSGKVLNQVFSAIEAFLADRLHALNPEFIATKDDAPLDNDETNRIAAEVQSRRSVNQG